MHKYNLQSCLHRGEFLRGDSARGKESQRQHHAGLQSAHKGPVCGIAMLGSTLVASASSDPQASLCLRDLRSLRFELPASPRYS